MLFLTPVIRSDFSLSPLHLTTPQVQISESLFLKNNCFPAGYSTIIAATVVFVICSFSHVTINWEFFKSWLFKDIYFNFK